jgi:hypothetical protein
MPASLAPIVRKLLLLPLAATLCVALGGWDEDELRYQYRAHSDKVTRGAGNAAAANIAAQTIDPWPPSSQRTHINQDGKRAYLAIKRYESNTSIAPKGINSANGFGGNGNGTLAAPAGGPQH